MTDRNPSHHTSRGVFPLMERPVPAVLLALVSGLLNAWTFEQVQTFATVQSGNIVTLGYSLADGNWMRSGTVFASIVVFTVGAAVCAVAVALFERASRAYSASILAFEGAALVVCVVLAATGVSPAVIALIISFLAGVQGNAFHRETGMLYGNVAVTFVLQSVGSLLGRGAIARFSSDGQPHVRPAGEYLVVLIGFGAGGAIGFGISNVWSGAALIVAALILAGLAIAATATRTTVDPSQNNPTP